MEEIKKFMKSIGVIPNNMEKYMAFFLGNQLKFIDSFQFMSKSLEFLVENISFSDMKYTSQEFQLFWADENLSWWKEKVFIPTIIWICFDKFNDATLPPKK